MVSSLNLFSSSVPTRERVYGERNLGVRSELPLLARRKLVFEMFISVECVNWNHHLRWTIMKSQSRSVRLSSWIPTDHYNLI